MNTINLNMYTYSVCVFNIFSSERHFLKKTNCSSYYYLLRMNAPEKTHLGG